MLSLLGLGSSSARASFVPRVVSRTSMLSSSFSTSISVLSHRRSAFSSVLRLSPRPCGAGISSCTSGRISGTLPRSVASKTSSSRPLSRLNALSNPPAASGRRSYYTGRRSRSYYQSSRLVSNIIIGANVAVFGAWQMVENIDEMRFMQYNFSSSFRNLQMGYYWTLLTSAFSHKAFLHLFVNMFVLHSFAGPLLSVLGPSRFLTLYLGGAIASSCTHILFVINQRKDSNSIGASGSINSLLLTYACLFPSSYVALFGIIPVPTPLAVTAFVAYDFLYMGDRSGIDHAGHLGGAAFGVLYYLLRLR